VTNRHKKGSDAQPADPGADPSPLADAPGLVTNTGTQRLARRSFLGGAAVLAALGSLATASDGTGAGRPSAAPASGPPAVPAPPRAAPTATPEVVAATSGVDAELIAQRYLGLKPFRLAPPPPLFKPVTLSATDPTVFSQVPLTDNVVFVTIDDGIEKDPRFIQMVRDFQVPLTVCLTDALIRDDYAYFERLYETGYVSIQNHTMTHPMSMPALSAAQQLDEIASQQLKLGWEYGAIPYIFRPPSGRYDETTIAATGQAGLQGLMLWKEAMQITDMEYQTSARRLSPGDIILCHFRGPAQLDGESMVHMMIHLYRRIQAQGFTIADITQYV
jgi:peptidoglycan/xylan/chitin deacetylase (PgdA/CDA1 family)